MDCNPDSGEVKKEHYHVMIMFEGVKTEEQVKAIFDKIGGVGIEYVQSIRGYARYLCHMDNPEKAQYNPSDVVEGGGADYRDVISLATDRRATLKEMRAFVRQNNITDFSDLYDYADEYNDNWSYLLDTNSAYCMKEYINSRWKKICKNN